MVNIIGAGLAGSILKRVLDQNKIQNKIYDCEKMWRASPISENLFSLTWSGTLGAEVLKTGLKTLEGVANISSINFKTKAGHNPTLHVHPDNILVKDYVRGYVRVDRGGNAYFPAYDDKKLPGIVVDCRGYWAQVKGQEMVGLTGQGLFIEGVLHKEPVMSFVAPYVHQKLFQWDKSFIWYGDSTCIEYNNYINKVQFYTDRCETRAKKLLSEQKETDHSYTAVEYGIRPWVKGHKGYLKLSKKYIVNTGGWKCGLIIYSYQAYKILNYLKRIL